MEAGTADSAGRRAAARRTACERGRRPGDQGGADCEERCETVLNQL
jgi:hypothetical protein